MFGLILCQQTVSHLVQSQVLTNPASLGAIFLVVFGLSKTSVGLIYTGVAAAVLAMALATWLRFSSRRINLQVVGYAKGLFWISGLNQGFLDHLRSDLQHVQSQTTTGESH